MTNFNRATNPVTLAGLGDPERWGAHADVDVPCPGIGRYSVRGPQMVRAQAPDLIARSWVVSVQWQTDGDATHVPLPAIEIRAGVGQNTSILVLDPVALLVTRPFFRAERRGIVIVGGSTVLPDPVPGSAIQIAPICDVEALAAAPGRVVRFSLDVAISPWSLG